MTDVTTDYSSWNVPALLAQTKERLTAIFKELPPADVSELDGEYAGFEFTDKTEEAFAARARRATAMPGGGWLGKAFRTNENSEPEGYNRIILPDGNMIRVDAFAISEGVGPDSLDGRPSLILDYRGFDHPGGKRGTVDEMRKLNDNVWLAYMTANSPDGGRTEPDFFILGAPATPWVGLTDPADLPQLPGPKA